MKGNSGNGGGTGDLTLTGDLMLKETVRQIRKAVKKYWGYDGFLPLQEEAISSVLGGTDTIVVLPTGGGKSLCFQVPALCMPGFTIVVSPLISLMKDQVDALKANGIAAERLDSSLDPKEQERVIALLRAGELKLLYVSPERLLNERFLDLIGNFSPDFIAIDEAHCVSMWGHDFRPEYRRLGMLKTLFPAVPVGAYTATATGPVRDDIALQLSLKDPDILVGPFDRPNLVYSVRPRSNLLEQVREVVERHKRESGIIYCIRRKDVDSMCDKLNSLGCRAAPYHAGMDDRSRKENQDLFILEGVDIIVATIAFGMGIDKSNVRYVIHTGMPKSLENYQQESGRAGRDGLEAECVLLYSGGDFALWKSMMKDMPPEAESIALEKLQGMYRFCVGGVCRHQSILHYFGRENGSPGTGSGNGSVRSCGACDICLGGHELHNDALVTAQKILSGVLRLRQRFGAAYNAQVLIGSREQKILDNGHDDLSTWGILKEYSGRAVRDWIEQLAGQGYLQRYGEYNVLGVTGTGRLVLKGEEVPRLLKPRKETKKKGAGSRLQEADPGWEGVDTGLFEELRNLRRQWAGERGVPPFVIFSDVTLRELAREQPGTREELLGIRGIGEKKAAQYGETLLQMIRGRPG